MQFKEWLQVNESVIVQTKGGESALGKARENNKMAEFSYSAGDYYSAFEVWPFSEKRHGYVQMSDGPATVIGIIKKTPIEAGNGADRAFIKSLTSALQASGLKPLPYKEGDSEWMGVLSKAGVEEDEPVMKDMKGEKEFSGTETPKMGTPAANSRKVSPAMSVSRSSGSWAYFFQTIPGHADFQIEKVVESMKRAAQPLVDNDIIEQYRIVRGWDYKNADTVWSNRGKSEHDDDETRIRKSAGYIKFLADRMLANHPKAREQVLKYFRHSWDKDVGPENARVPLEDLRKYVNWQHNESPFLTFFVDALKGDSTHMYDVMDDAAKTGDPDEAIRRYKEVTDEEYDYMVENPRLWMSGALNVLSMSDFMSKHASGQFERFRKAYEEAINDWLRSGETVRRGDLEDLRKLSQYIEIKGKDQIEDAHGKMKKAEEERAKKEEEDQKKAREAINRGEFKYMQAGKDESWKPIPHKYLNGDDVEVDELALGEDLVDREDLFHAAHEKASEEAYANAEERKSETYGQDRDEVESDIEDEWDEYMDDREFEEGEFDGLTDDQKMNKIKQDYFDDFADWKKEALKKDEEEESWRYEPEADEQDVRKYEMEMAEEKAYEDGLVVLKWPEDSEEIEVWLHSKNFEKARESTRKALKTPLNSKDRYGDPVLKGSQPVSFTFVDKGSGEGKVLRAREV